MPADFIQTSVQEYFVSQLVSSLSPFEKEETVGLAGIGHPAKSSQLRKR